MLNSLISKLNPNAELTPEDRTLYASKLEYIASRTNEIEKCMKNASDIEEKMRTIKNQVKQLEKTMSERQRSYNKLTASIQKLTDTINGFKHVAETTKETWSKFEGIEKMIEAEERKKNELENNNSLNQNKSSEELLSTIEIPALNEGELKDIVDN
jgi:septal ring factor EnvC (AmiA/AmiB activator)